ncbi:MAG: HAD-IC family P-type ATPase [Pirellulaceae bacterium]|nr:HAD-IC family P-type ATPase [Pirellulaceae bacterium]
MSPHSVGALPFAQTAEEVVLSLGSDPQTGLRGEEIEAARAKYGPNRLAEAPPEPWWRKIAAQFRELVIWILIVAAVISGAMGEWIDTAAIVAIVVLNAVIGYFQEERAQQALAALQKLSAPQAKTLRNGQLQVVPAEQLVVGDILELEAGDYIPADCRLLGGFDFTVQEAALTGESVPVEKDAAAILPATAPLGDRRNMAYLGTVAAAGKAKGVVVATGMRTELGRIAKLLERYQPETTPLERRLRELGRILIFVCLGIVGLIFALQTVRGSPLLESLLLAVSLAVAAVPEGLPAVVTMALALGLGRMVKRNVLVRKLPSVETLGCVTVVCSDKTGTLTRNEMTVREIVLDSGPLVVTGVGYAPHGEFRPRGEPVAIDSGSRDDLRRALTCGAWCNNARVVPQSDGVHWQVIGDPTEGALLVAARKAGIEPSRHAGEVLLEIPFDSTRKRMSVVVRGPDDSRTMYAKGAPEVLLPLAVAERTAAGERPLSDEARAEWLRRGGEMAERGLRVLALADRELPPGDAGLAEERLVLAGLVGITDPPREEVKVAIEQCRAAGIRPVMITGDHPATALAIGRELHLAEPGARALSGRELDDLSDEALVAQAPEIAVYARVTAEHKLRIVQAWKSRGEIVAMTGDGVNDAPAIKMADIGIAMGVTGTDVTKEAAHGADRRQLYLHRQRGRGRTRHLRQHSKGAAISAVVQPRRNLADAGRQPARLAGTAASGAIAVDQSRHRWPSRARLVAGAAGTGRDAAAAASHRRVDPLVARQLVDSRPGAAGRLRGAGRIRPDSPAKPREYRRCPSDDLLRAGLCRAVPGAGLPQPNAHPVAIGPVLESGIAGGDCRFQSAADQRGATAVHAIGLQGRGVSAGRLVDRGALGAGPRDDSGSYQTDSRPLVGTCNAPGGSEAGLTAQSQSRR